MIFTSCKDSGKNSILQNKDNSYYFLGLKAADENDNEKAIEYFKKARDSKDSLEIIKKRSAESLVLLGNVAERNEAAQTLATRFQNNDEELLIASRELFRQSEYSKILEITDSINLETAPNELVKIRLDSMLEKKDKRFDDEYFKWTISRKLTAEHLEFYQKYFAKKMAIFKEKQNIALEKYENELKKRIEEWKEKWLLENPNQELDENLIPKRFDNLEIDTIDLPFTDSELIVDFKVFIYRRKYKEAYNACESVIRIFEKRELEKLSELDIDEGLDKTIKLDISEQILSDIGKAYLYGTDNYLKSAKFLDSLSEKLDNEKAFYTYFYAARLYDKTKNHQNTVVERYKDAINTTQDSKKIDNALWYLLSFQMNNSTKDMLETLQTYKDKADKSEYFDDFFEKLAFNLLSKQKYQTFYDVYKSGFKFSERILSQFAYISGRLLDEKLATSIDDEKSNNIYEVAIKTKGNLYYKICAIERLNITDSEKIEQILTNKYSNESNNEILEESSESDFEKENDKEIDNSSDILFEGYATFGFPQRVYAEWLLNRNKTSITTSINASKFLNNCGQFDSTYNTQSLRIANRTKDKIINESNGELSRELLELLYPRFFSEKIENVCEKNKLSTSLLYSLIRTESFFDPKISSAVGAAGLTQLMKATADDEAKKLKLPKDYDILDPETNLAIGSHYLKSLIERVDENVPILALFAYNGGLGNVRKWLKESKKNWAKLKRIEHKPAGMSMDLFLETLAFSETRDYGRQTIASAAMYDWLYENKNPSQTVREILYAE